MPVTASGYSSARRLVRQGLADRAAGPYCSAAMKTTFGKRAAGARLERMKASPRWLDGAFQNVHPILPELKTGVPMPPLRDFLCGGARRVPVGALPALDPREWWLKPPETGLRATWLGHSTLLLEIDGVRVL